MTWLIAIAAAGIGYFFGFARKRLRSDKRHADQVRAIADELDRARDTIEEMSWQTQLVIGPEHLSGFNSCEEDPVIPWTGPVPDQVPHATVVHQGPIFPIDPCEDDV